MSEEKKDNVVDLNEKKTINTADLSDEDLTKAWEENSDRYLKSSVQFQELFLIEKNLQENKGRIGEQVEQSRQACYFLEVERIKREKEGSKEATDGQ